MTVVRGMLNDSGSSLRHHWFTVLGNWFTALKQLFFCFKTRISCELVYYSLEIFYYAIFYVLWGKFILFYYFYFSESQGGICVCHTYHRTAPGSCFSFYNMGPGDWTHVIIFDDRNLYLSPGLFILLFLFSLLTWFLSLRQASIRHQTQRSTYLWISSVGTKDMCCHT